MSLSFFDKVRLNGTTISIDRERLLDWSWTLLIFLYLYYTFIGLHPMQDDDIAARTEGNQFDQIFALLMFAVSLVVISLRPMLSLHIARRSWPIVLILVWCSLSYFWSDFPDLTLRRTVLLIILTFIPFSIAVGARDIYGILSFFMFFMGFTVIVNLLSVVLYPDYAITDIGVRGIYMQKNLTGMVATIAVFIDVAWLIGVRNVVSRVIGLVCFGLSCVFLRISGSKTSMGLSVLMVLMVPATMAFLARGVLFRRAAAVVLGVGVVVFALLIWGSNMTRTEVLTLLFGDPTFTARTDIWQFAVQEIGKRFWSGTGYGAFWDVGEANDPLLRAPPGTFLDEIEYGLINQAHNGYLDLWLQVGFPAVFLAVLAIVDATYQAVVLNISRNRAYYEKGLALFCLLVILLYDFNNLMEATLFSKGLLLNNAAMLAIFIVYRMRLSENAAKSDPIAA